MRSRMRLSMVVVPLLLAACASGGMRPEGSVSAADQFERLKTLEGAWVTVADSPMQAETIFTVTANGSALMERIFPGSPHEMITMYHLDGDDLVLTHYCAAQNQPSMRALPGPDTTQIRFEFTSLANGDPEKDMHMHDAVLTFPDDGRFRPVWRSFENGEPGEFSAELDFVRKE